jgi:predicted TIM-barrel fold metal-dependent hydrolase
MQTSNVTAIVNLDGRWGDELEANLDRYDRGYPGRFATFCQLDWREASQDGFGARLAQSVQRGASAGAKGLKVWKDLGLHVRDPKGELLMPDDARLNDVWTAAGEFALPVVIHTADPVAFFEPLDEHNERLEELVEQPDWWFGDRDRFPSFDRLMEALESLVASHPATTFIAAHAGCAEDVGWLGRMLDTYSNFNADIAARIGELGRTPSATRRLFLAHPNRLLLGTDEFPPDPRTYEIYFRFLETADESFDYSPDEVPPQGRWQISALDLPDDVLRAVEGGNARRLISGLAGTGAEPDA